MGQRGQQGQQGDGADPWDGGATVEGAGPHGSDRSRRDHCRPVPSRPGSGPGAVCAEDPRTDRGHDAQRQCTPGRGFAVAALALLALSGCQKPAAQAAPPPPTVGVVESRRMSVPVLVTPNGTTRALEDVTIRARVRGFLTERHFAEGATVKKGQLLLVIDEEPYKVALQSARARQAEAEAALQKAEESKGREVAAAQLDARPGPAAARPDPGAAQPDARWPATPARPRTSTRPRPTASGGRRRSRPTAPTSTRRRPTTTSGSPRPRRRSRPPGPPSATPS